MGAIRDKIRVICDLAFYPTIFTYKLCPFAYSNLLFTYFSFSIYHFHEYLAAGFTTFHPLSFTVYQYFTSINLPLMKKFLTLFVSTCLVTAVLAANMVKKPAVKYAFTTLTNTDTTPVAKTYHYQVFKQASNSFGYDIYSGPKKIIHQENIPGQPGNKGFTTSTSAAKVAGLVVGKLQKNVWPPVVSTEELKQLHVL